MSDLVAMDPDTGKPWDGNVDMQTGLPVPVLVPRAEVGQWQRSWIGKQSLLAQMPLRECPAREAGQR